MKTGGHYFCDHCDDVAFGAVCQACHHPARFIPAAGETAKPKALEPAPVETTPRRPPGARQANAKEWFARMRAAVRQTPE